MSVNIFLKTLLFQKYLLDQLIVKSSNDYLLNTFCHCKYFLENLGIFEGNEKSVTAWYCNKAKYALFSPNP